MEKEQNINIKEEIKYNWSLNDVLKYLNTKGWSYNDISNALGEEYVKTGEWDSLPQIYHDNIKGIEINIQILCEAEINVSDYEVDVQGYPIVPNNGEKIHNLKMKEYELLSNYISSYKNGLLTKKLDFLKDFHKNYPAQEDRILQIGKLKGSLEWELLPPEIWEEEYCIGVAGELNKSDDELGKGGSLMISQFYPIDYNLSLEDNLNQIKESVYNDYIAPRIKFQKDWNDYCEANTPGISFDNSEEDFLNCEYDSQFGKESIHVSGIINDSEIIDKHFSMHSFKNLTTALEEIKEMLISDHPELDEDYGCSVHM